MRLQCIYIDVGSHHCMLGYRYYMTPTAFQWCVSLVLSLPASSSPRWIPIAPPIDRPCITLALHVEWPCPSPDVHIFVIGAYRTCLSTVIRRPTVNEPTVINNEQSISQETSLCNIAVLVCETCDIAAPWLSCSTSRRAYQINIFLHCVISLLCGVSVF